MHALVDALGNGLHLVLTPGEAADSAQLPGLLAALPQAPGAVVADKAYDTNQALAAIAERQAQALIPPKANRGSSVSTTKTSTPSATKSNASLAASRKPAVLPPVTRKPPPPF